jgi:hypothetical protein
MTTPRKTVTITVTLPTDEALALAQFCKRVGWSDCRANAVDSDEAYRMVAALDRVRTGLAAVGYSPR